MTGTLVEWELRRAGRMKSTYAFRAGGILITILILLLAWMTHWMAGLDAGGFETIMREQEFFLLRAAPAPLQFIAVLGIAPILAALALAAERRNRTLNLLLQTGMSPAQLWAAKYTAVFAQCLALLLASLPIMFAVGRIGGFDLTVLVGQWALLTVGGGSLCAIGLMCSAWSFRPEQALMRVGGIIVGWTLAGILLVSFAPGSSRYVAYLFAPAFVPAIDPDMPILAGILSGVGTSIFGALAAVLTIRKLPVLVTAEPIARKRAVTAKRKVESGAQAIRFLVQAATPDLGMAQLGRLQIGPTAFVVALCLVAAVPFIGGLLLTPFMIFLLVNNLHVLRQEGMLDLIRLSPMEDDDLGRVLHRAQWRLALMFLPATFTLAIVGYFTNEMMTNVPGAPTFGLWEMVLSTMPGYFLTAGIGCWAATWRNPSVLRNAVLGIVASYVLPMIVAIVLVVPMMIVVTTIAVSTGGNPNTMVWVSTGIQSGGTALAALLFYLWLNGRYRRFARDGERGNYRRATQASTAQTF